ncbi:hypothetical protein BFG06_05045 [Aeromonas caviae]|nr:hypothetical protein BFG06_05045 [Aeromonas caviae]
MGAEAIVGWDQLFRQQFGRKTTACAVTRQTALMPMTMEHSWQLMISVVVGHTMELIILGNTVCAPAPILVLYIVQASHP